jgi:two-component system NtrC family response regulator/two-component system response regulator AtoC
MLNRSGRSILVVDDEEGMRLGIKKALTLEGYQVTCVATGEDARRIGSRERFDCAFIDLRLPDIVGTELLPELRKSGTAVVMMTAYATVDTAVRAMKLGAVDYLQKPFDNQDVVALAGRLCSTERKEAGGDPSSGAHSGSRLVAASPAMNGILQTLRKVVDSDINILIQGESGTGKEMLARFVHEESRRSNNPYVAINCAAIPSELLESELFGHERGSFTGAHASVTGKFEAAKSGTIFLDEIGDMNPQLQTKLLRAIEERSFDPIGSTRSVPLTARLVASTNRDLKALISENRFRLDLYYRLKGIAVTIPPLRERREDIEPLVNLFLDKYKRCYEKGGIEISREAMHFLVSYRWLGNVRELKNAVESAVLLSDQPRSLLPSDFLLEPDGDVHELWQHEREGIIETLVRTGYNRSNASQKLGMSRKTLYNKMKRYGIK